MKRKKKCFLVLFLFLSATSGAQVSLEQCYDSARVNYPLIRQQKLLEATRQFTLENIKKAFVPQVSLSARASWQSDVTEIPFQVPGVRIDGMEQDQYQFLLELKQQVYDGGMVRARKDLQQATTDADWRQMEVDMYALRQRIDEVYFGVLLHTAKLKQMQLLTDQLQKSRQLVDAFLKRGVACQADVDAVAVELHTARQSERAVRISREAYCEVLSLLTGISSLQPEHLSVPETAGLIEENRRPELQLFDQKKAVLEAQRKSIVAGIRPTLGIFMQGAYSDPGLNMLRGGFRPYYIGGVQLSWNFGKFYTFKNDKRLISEQMKQVDVQRDLFLLNTRAEMIQARAEVDRIRQEIEDDEEIIRLRGQIRRSAESRVSNGTLSVLDMLRMVLDEDQARQSKATHEIELLQAQYRMKRIWNN